MIDIVLNNFPTADFALLIILFLGAWEFWNPREKDKKNHLDNYILTSLYFLFFAFIIFITYYERLTPYFQDFRFQPLLILILSFVVFFFIYKFFKLVFEKPKDIIKKYPSEYFLYMDNRYFFSKSSDIVFQQVAIIAMVDMFKDAGMDLFLMIISFAVVFGLIHIPLVRTKGRDFGAYFILAAIISAIFFPFLIIQFNYGFVYSFIIHWLFYIFSGMLFWIKYNFKSKSQ
ncbi:MAG: hypothetical protein WDZ80_05950 [Candidatus Paceibacterota bacterium]